MEIFRITTLAWYNEGFHKPYILIADSSVYETFDDVRKTGHWAKTFCLT